MKPHSETTKDPHYSIDSSRKADGIIVVREIEWSPGNGSRYHVVFTRLLDRQWLVTYVNSKRCMATPENRNMIHWDHVLKRMDLDNIDDAAHMAMLIGEILERPYQPVDEVLAG